MYFPFFLQHELLDAMFLFLFEASELGWKDGELKKKHQKTVKMDQLRHCQATMCSNVWSLLRLSQMLSLSYRQLGQLWSGRTEDLKMWIRMKWAPSPSRASSESNKTWTWRLALLTSAYRLQEINLPKMQFLEELPNCLNT